MANLVGKYVDRYHILKELGAGGIVVVYKAYDTRMGREVTVKFIQLEEFGLYYQAQKQHESRAYGCSCDRSLKHAGY